MSSDENAHQLLLVSLLQDFRVPNTTLCERYPGFMRMLKAVNGEDATAPCYLAVWPPAFDSQNSAFVNFYLKSLHGAPKHIKNLVFVCSFATAVSDRCPYMEAHVLVRSARLGFQESKAVAILCADTPSLSAAEKATIEVVQHLAKPRPTLTKETKEQFIAAVGTPGHAERIISTTFVFSFMDKVMDAIAIELEQTMANIATGCLGAHGWKPGVHGWLLDPIAEPCPLPPKEGFFASLKRLKYIPGAISYVAGLDKGVPANWTKLQMLLQQTTGHGFPFMSRIQSPHLRRGLAVLLVRNMDQTTTMCGLAVKCLVLKMFATYVQSRTLALAVDDMANKFQVSQQDLDNVQACACSNEEICTAFANKQVAALLSFAKSLLPMPCKVTPEIVKHLQSVDVGAAVIVELVLWVSLLQMLHRMAFYFEL